MTAVQKPPDWTEPLLTANPVGRSSIVNNTFEINVEPSRFSRPLPLSETTRPETLKLDPATGFSVIWSTTMNVSERTVTLLRLACVGNRSELPL